MTSVKHFSSLSQVPTLFLPADKPPRIATEGEAEIGRLGDQLIPEAQLEMALRQSSGTRHSP
jgi:hypothetical protein